MRLSRLCFSIAMAATATGLLAGGAVAHAAPAYRIDLLSNAYSEHGVTTLNNQGDAAARGAGIGPTWPASVFYDGATGAANSMNVVDGYTVFPGKMNSKGQTAVLLQPNGAGAFGAGLYDPATRVVTRMPAVPGELASVAHAVNDSGTVVGYSVSSGQANQRATIWSNGAATVLGTPSYSEANDINNAGMVVGFAGPGPGQQGGAFLYDGKDILSLGTLGGASSNALALNNHNVVVGFSATNDVGRNAPFIYSQGVMTEIGGGVDGMALDINDSGTVVGNTSRFGGFVYVNGEFSLLSELVDKRNGWYVEQASAVNDAGQIGARVCSFTNQCRDAVLTPVPEPATYGMLLGGLGVVGLMARRRRGVFHVS